VARGADGEGFLPRVGVAALDGLGEDLRLERAQIGDDVHDVLIADERQRHRPHHDAEGILRINAADARLEVSKLTQFVPVILARDSRGTDLLAARCGWTVTGLAHDELFLAVLQILLREGRRCGGQQPEKAQRHHDQKSAHFLVLPVSP
jgi:hypothetical protein